MLVQLDQKKYEYEFYELLRFFLPKEEIRFKGEDQDTLIQSDKDKNITLYIEGKRWEKQVPEIRDPKKQKRAYKKAAVDLLESAFQKKCPWGVLTGIRPVKIIQELMDEGYGEGEIFTIMTQEYGLSEEKARLIQEVAKTQRPFLYPIHKNSYSLYLNIPFCPTRCDYCSFPTHLYKKKDIRKEYVDLLLYEMEELSKPLQDLDLDAIYIGGGTPTALEIEDLERLLDGIRNHFSTWSEWTVEAGREDTLTAEKLILMKKKGVTRISLNPQTFHQPTLERIGRRQDNERLLSLYKEAKKIGFEAINMDFILGLPGEGLEELEKNLKKIESLLPENLTIHTLSVKRGSKFMERNRDLFQEKETIDAMIDRVEDFLKDSPYKPYYLYRQKQILGNYENIGYALEGKENRYNMYIMEERQSIIGLGMTANTKFLHPESNRIVNYRNFKNMKDYQEQLQETIEAKKRIIKGEIIERI